MGETFNTTAELIENWPGLEPEHRAALLSALATRGRWKGYVLASAPSPSKAPERYAAWQALMAELAPARLSIGGLWLLPKPARLLFDRLTLALGGQLGLAIKAQEPDLRWSLFAYHYDVQGLRERFYTEIKGV